MKCVPFEGQTSVLGAPKDWDEQKHGECAGLPVKWEDGQGFVGNGGGDDKIIDHLAQGAKGRVESMRASIRKALN